MFARRSHLNHHAFTLISAYDLEMLPRPLRLWKVWVELFALYSGPLFLGAMVVHALGRPTRMARRVVPEGEWPALFWAARAALLLWLAPIALSLALHSWLPVLLFGLPRFYGGALVWLFVVTQHAGLATNVSDHRLRLRRLMAPYMLPAYRGLRGAWKEILPALLAQRRDPGYFVRREPPPG